MFPRRAAKNISRTKGRHTLVHSVHEDKMRATQGTTVGRRSPSAPCVYCNRRSARSESDALPPLHEAGSRITFKIFFARCQVNTQYEVKEMVAIRNKIFLARANFYLRKQPLVKIVTMQRA